jgi:hypothetical protein
LAPIFRQFPAERPPPQPPPNLEAAAHATATADATIATAVTVTEDVAGTHDAAVDLNTAAYASATADANITTAVNVTDDDAGPADSVIDLAPDVISIKLSYDGDPLCSRFDAYIPIVGNHMLTGLVIQYGNVRARLLVLSIENGTPGACTPHWRSRLHHACLLGVDNIDICTLADLTQTISVLRSNGTLTCHLRLTFEDVNNTLSVSDLPQLYFEQLRDIRRVTQQLRSNQPKAPSLTHTGLHTQPDWNEWVSSAEEQVDAYDVQDLFGNPCLLPKGASVFCWVWLYKITTEDSIRKKAYAICDGSTHGGPAPISGHIYAPTPDMTDLRLCFALSVLEHKLISGADVSHVFAEASALPQVYNMRVATQFREWWAARNRLTIPQGRVIPILTNLPGQPKAP